MLINKKIIYSSLIFLGLASVFFIFTSQAVLAADFKVDINTTDDITEWKINSDGIYKNDSKIYCSDIQVGSIPDDGFLVENSLGTKLFLIAENNIYVSAKDSFASLTYSDTITNSFILKKQSNDILIYVDDDGLHYKEGICESTPSFCGDGNVDPGEQCEYDSECPNGFECNSCMCRSKCGSGIIPITNCHQLTSWMDNFYGSFPDGCNDPNSWRYGDFCLVNDIDCSGENLLKPLPNFDADTEVCFEGTFDGRGHTISNLDHADWVNNMDRVGLFMCTENAEIKNVNLANVYIKGDDYVGALVGRTYGNTIISNCSASGTVTTGVGDSSQNIGGLIGGTYDTAITNCYSSVNVNPESIAYGAVSVGGLVGYNQESTISNCYSDGDVSSIDNGWIYIGGLVGANVYGSQISYSYSTGSVSAPNIDSPYDSVVGGLVGGVGSTPGFTSSSYWNTVTSGQSTSDGGEPRTTDQMTYPFDNTYIGWDFDDVWSNDGISGHYPCLQWYCEGGQQSVCGNDILEAGEECDDNNNVDFDGCAANCYKEYLVFLTSETYNGNLGGMDGADQKCQDFADSNDLDGTFYAWISTDADNDPESRFPHVYRTYYKLGGVKIADDWDDLTDGSIDSPINVSEQGNQIIEWSPNVWTNVNVYGQFIDGTKDCSNFNSNSDGNDCRVGYSSQSDLRWTYRVSMDSCHTENRLYCFEVE